MKDTEIEQWVGLKQGVDDTYSNYMISSLGRVFNLKSGNFASHVLTGKPRYYYVNLVNDNGDRRLRRVHNIMGWSFLGDIPNEGDTIDHIDRNKYNNSLYNLRWLSMSGQIYNRDERTNTLKYFINERYSEEDYNKVYNYISSLMRVVECTMEEASNVYNLRDKHSTLSQPFRYKGYLTILEELCSVFNKNIDYTKLLLSRGEDLCNILLNNILVPMNETVLNYSIEFDGSWYPNRVSLRYHLNLPDGVVKDVIGYGSLSKYQKYLEDREHRKKFTAQLQKERVHGKDWGNGIFGTIRGLSRKYNIPNGTLWHRVQKADYTMKEALELPLGNRDQYWKLGIKYHLKSEVCSMVGLNQPNITQRCSKSKCPVMYAIIPEDIKCNDKSRIFILNGNAFWYNDLKYKLGVESKLSIKSVLKEHQSIKGWLYYLGAIDNYDNFEEVVF